MTIAVACGCVVLAAIAGWTLPKVIDRIFDRAFRSNIERRSQSSLRSYRSWSNHSNFTPPVDVEASSDSDRFETVEIS